MCVLWLRVDAGASLPGFENLVLPVMNWQLMQL